MDGRENQFTEPRSKKVKRDENVRFSISKERGKKFKKLLCEGMEKDESKELGRRFSPSFHRSFISEKLVVPTPDDSMYQRLAVVKNSKAGKKSIDLHEKALFKIHRKVLDATRTLLFLANEKLADVANHEAISTAISLVCDAFHSVTEERHQTVLRQTSPSFTFMLGNKSNFTQDEMEDLFGRSFVKEMVKSADTVKKLANMARSGHPDRTGGNNSSMEQHYNGGVSAGPSQAFGIGSSNKGSSYGGGSNGSSGDYHNNLNGSYRDPFHGRGASRFHYNSHNHGRYVITYINPILPVVDKVSLAVNASPFQRVSCPASRTAGRIQSFASNWKTISSDPWVLNVLSEGFKPEFTSSPFQSAPAPNIICLKPNLKSVTKRCSS
ncbi:hypothetical protein GHT06_016973 [Daphnia sinensis]|uniref:Uncharacterized protein n=1 Tax=Daphnia sinensis TaxID=1820382 RepID=A0AAD5KP93_9CRUS|nr:hypothetical protein GHT06_016973 [Daphnia sinensis]